MKYAVDKLEDNIVVLENLDTKEIKNVELSKFDFNIKEKDIIIYKNNKYIKDDKLKQDRLKLMQEKLNKVKNI